jgi:O-succinylbenzoate synthase
MMHLRRVVLRRLEMPLKFRFRTSFGEMTRKRFLLVEAQADGLSGWGECVAEEEPLYSEETNEGARHVLGALLIPAALSSGSDPAEFERRVAPIRGNRMAKAALETALWDLAARRAGVPISALIGGVRDRVAVGVSLGLQPTTAELLALVDRHVAAGYRRIKIKIEPGRDVALVSAVRARFPKIELTVDANAAYRPEDAGALAALDGFALDYIEQPLGHEDLWEHAALARRLRTPICLDESIRSAADAAVAAEIGAARVVNVKIGRVGGLAEARRIHDVCARAGIPVWCGGMLESGVGRAMNIQLATLPNFVKPGDTSSASRYFDEDIVDPPLEADHGEMPVPAGPGIGVEVLRHRVQQYTISSEEFVP